MTALDCYQIKPTNQPNKQTETALEALGNLE